MTQSTQHPTASHPTLPEDALRHTLQQLPTGPGVYRYYDAHHKLLYVGKAKNLKNRVSSYFNNRGKHASPRTEALVAKIHHLETVLTSSEHEALLLEDNLIKTHRPPYNISLKDDKRYPWILITDEPYPRVLHTRRIDRAATSRTKRRNRIFGPYSNVGAMRDMLKIIRQHFPVRQRKSPLFRDRPCINYSIGTCPAPCQQHITAEAYGQTIEQIILLLKGHTESLLAKIEHDMAVASEALNFEWAAKLRDRHKAVESVLSKQQVVSLNDPRLKVDVVGLAHDDHRCAVVVWRIRQGRLVESTTHHVPLHHAATPEDALEGFLPQYYADLTADQLPEELIVPYPAVDEEERTWLSQFIAEYGDSLKNSIPITVPQRGTKKELLEGATRNAEEALRIMQTDARNHIQRDPAGVLHELQKLFNLPSPPMRLECYDISHIQGTHTVASMVVFTNGQPDNAQYRRFNIECAEGSPDDFASMHEALTRRARHLPERTDSASVFKKKSKPVAIWPKPDLVIIDGGKGQLSAARQAMDACGMSNIATIALAKRLEEVFLPNNPTPIRLARDSAVLFLLQHIRDEAHRFAITRHRARRTKAAKISSLDNIPGIGPKRKQQLIAEFGSLTELKQASLNELKTRGGLNALLAERVYAALKTETPER